jgi:hypothetical protein
MGFIDLWVNEDWNKFQKQDVQSFEGTVLHQTTDSVGFGRSLPYKLKTDKGTFDIYCGETDELKSFIGQHVIIEGKFEAFELEGSNLQEIWPCRIKVVGK